VNISVESASAVAALASRSARSGLPSIADVHRDPLRVLEHALGRGGVARQRLGHRVEAGHPDGGLLEAQLGDALARRREVAACELEAPGHRVQHRFEPAHGQGRVATGHVAPQAGALANPVGEGARATNQIVPVGLEPTVGAAQASFWSDSMASLKVALGRIAAVAFSRSTQ
jgi:hypothetical protein